MIKFTRRTIDGFTAHYSEPVRTETQILSYSIQNHSGKFHIYQLNEATGKYERLFGLRLPSNTLKEAIADLTNYVNDYYQVNY